MDITQKYIFSGLVLVFAMAGLVFAILSEQLQIFAKYRGVLRKKIAGGYNSAMKIMVVNRLGAVIYFLLIGFSIESGASSGALLIGYSFAMLILFVANSVLFYRLKIYLLKSDSGITLLPLTELPRGIILASFFATTFNLLGLTLPWLAGSYYQEFRLTLANMSFVFNSIFTIINVYYIEHRFALAVDEEASEIHSFLFSIVVSRIFASFFMSIVFGMLYAFTVQ